jgi:ELWxxDGT repeat protein
MSFPLVSQIEALETRCLLSASLVQDLNKAPGESPLCTLGAIGDWWIFAQDDGVHGTELYRSNATGGGTFMLKDIVPGVDSSNPSFLGATGKLLYFTIDLNSKQSLWRTDGTSAGTIKLKDLTTSGYEASLGDTFYFLASDATHGQELWKSDGTVNGTVMVRDLLPGKGSGASSWLMVFKSALYLGADDGVHGEELWKSDGTSAGTKMLAELTPGKDGSHLHDYLATDNALYFTDHAYDYSGYQNHLWKTDGTKTSIIATSDYFELDSVGNTLYFIPRDGSLWRSNDSGTRQLKASGVSYFKRFAGGARDRLYAGDFVIKGDNLRVLPIDYGYSGMQVGNLLYGNPDEKNNELWRTDGKKDGTFQLLHVPENPYVLDLINGFTVVGSDLYFISSNDMYEGGEYGPYANDVTLWKTDGSVAGTKKIKFLKGSTNIGLFASFEEGVVANKTLYFTLTDNQHGAELYKTDGTESGTRMLRDIFTGTADCDPQSLTTGPGGTYFTTNLPQGAWVKADGGKPVQLITESSEILGVYKGRMLIATEHALWLSDGTKAGTTKFFQLPDRKADVHQLRDPHIVGNTIVFREVYWSYDPYSETAINWQSDGTAKGTHSLSATETPLQGTKLGNVVVFADEGLLVRTDFQGKNRQVLKSGFYGREIGLIEGAVWFEEHVGQNIILWRTDGTAQGTKNVTTLSGVDYDPLFAVMKNALYLKYEYSLWRVNLATGATLRLATFDGDYPWDEFIWVVGDKVMFSAKDKTHGEELWISDGTVSGTRLVKDICSGSGDGLMFHTAYGESESHYASSSAVFGKTLYFAAADNKNGIELWKSDGTEKGTVLVQDFYPGDVHDSWPKELKVVGSKLLFSVITVKYGRELWEMDLT